MSVFVGGYKWIGITVATLVLSFLLSGCVTLTEQGAVLGGTVLIRPVVDTRIVPPEVIEEIEAETGRECVDINEDDVEVLQKIRHIGEQRAQQIVGLRPFSSAEDLIRVSGIGDIRLEMILRQNLVCEIEAGE